MALPIGLFAAGIAAAASGVLPAAAAFTLVVVAMVLLRVIRPAQVYESIDWPVIVLLGAMIPLGDALQDTGAAQLIAGSILMISGEVGPLVVLGAVLLMTMAITPVLNNAATVVIMAPIVISIAARMGRLAGPVSDCRRDRGIMRISSPPSGTTTTPSSWARAATASAISGASAWGSRSVVIAVSLLVIPIVWPF